MTNRLTVGGLLDRSREDLYAYLDVLTQNICDALPNASEQTVAMLVYVILRIATEEYRLLLEKSCSEQELEELDISFIESIQRFKQAELS
jgi:hypothetical protein